MDALEINTERINISREVKTELMNQVKGIIQTNQIYNSQNLKSWVTIHITIQIIQTLFKLVALFKILGTIQI